MKTIEHTYRKMSEVLKEMAELLLRNPGAIPSADSAAAALFIAHIAWNESTGISPDRKGHLPAFKTIEADNPSLWDDFETTDLNAMIDRLIAYKAAHYPSDQRRILTCAVVDDKVRVEWRISDE